MCFPRWDSGAVFSSLIGGSGGYSITPEDRFVWGGYYEPDSLIWRSRWVSGEATVECREALALPSSADRAVILRRVIARKGKARVGVALNPRGDFGGQPLRKLAKRDDGAWTGEVGDAHVCWTGAEDASPQADGHGGKELTLALELEEGEHHDFVLVLAAEGADVEAPDPDWAWQGTEAEWAGTGARARQQRRPARQSPCLRGAQRPDRGQRRDGRRGHHLAARACPPGSQLRLPLRLDPGPVLHRPGGRQGGSAPVDGRRGPLRLRAAPRGRTEPDPRLHDRAAVGCPTSAS